MITIESVSDPSASSSGEEAIQIVHSTPGRLRVRLVWLEYYPSLHQRLFTSLSALATVTQVRLYPENNSIVVCYDAQTIAEQAFQEKFSQLIQQVTPAAWLNQEKPIPISNNASNSLSARIIAQKIQETGGKLIGSTVGQVMGFGMGAVAGGILLGPLGLISGAGLGTVVGRAFGSQLGSETVRHFAQIEGQEQRSPKEPENPLSALQSTLERGTTGLIGETVGGMAGMVVGASLLGPVGSLLGGVAGGVIGGEVGEEWWYWQKAEKDQS